MSDDVLGVDLLSYPEKFDIALKLGPLRGAIYTYVSTDCTINECLNLSYNQPDYHMSHYIFDEIPKSELIVSSLTQVYWLKHVLSVKPHTIRSLVRKIPNLNKIITSWKNIVNINVGHIFSIIPSDLGANINSGLNELIQEIPSNKYFHLATFLYATDRRIINLHKQLAKKCQSWIASPHPKPEIKPVIFKCPELNLTLKMGWDVGVLHIGDHKFVIDRDLFLLWVNKMGELACAILYTMTQRELFNHQGPDKLVSLLKICCKVMLKPTRRGDWNNQIGFAFPKSLEAVGVGMIIAHEDKKKGWDNNLFLLNTLEGLIEDGVLSDNNAESTDIFNFFSSLTSPEISELIGSVKLVGHPDIDIEAGLTKLHLRTHHDIEVDPRTIRNARGYLLFEFCQRYFQRVGTWPPLVIPQDVNYHRLRILVESGTSPLSTEFSTNQQLDYNEWGYIDIDPCIENDYWESPLEFLKDTAISPNRESAWAYCLRNKLQPDETLQIKLKKMSQKRKYNLRDSNRLIIQFLLSDDLYWRSLEYRKNWARTESIEELETEASTYWVIKLTPKERELKMEGRFFGASPVCERDRRIQVEGVLANMMRKMFPEQMLTATELEFNQKLIKFRNYRKLYPNHHVIQLCFDFQAWNNYMRKEFIDQGIGPVLDGIFNTHAYSRTMEFYERSLIFCDTNEIISAWKGQRGGIEGLNQATWTLATLTGLKVALCNLGYKFEVSVKGDDCRAAIMIPKNECRLDQLNQESQRIKQVLTDYCLQTGMHLKPEETFVSLSIIASSKQYQLDDIILPCGLKQALKMAHHSNTAFPTTQDLLSDIMSSCHSACFQTPFIISTWCAGVYIALQRVNLDHFIFKSLNEDMITAFGLWPQVLGGPGILPLELFIVRGENDLISIVYSLYQFVFNHVQNPFLHQILWNILCIPDKTTIHWKLLLSDPYSLNKDHPTTPSQFLKSSLRAQIKKITRNPMLKTLMDRETEEGEEYLVQSLVTMRPAHLKVMTGVYENSCFAVLDKVLARIDNSASIFALLGAHKGYVRTKKGSAILKKASHFHLKQVQWWMKILTMELNYRELTMYNISIQEFSHSCSTRIAQLAREASWGIPVFSITYPSLTRQFHLLPSNQGTDAEFLINVKPHCALYNLKGVQQLMPQSDHSHPFFASPVEVNPWIGGKTASKTVLPGYPLLHKSAALPKIEALLEIYARVVPLCPDLQHIIKWLVRIMVPLSDDDFGYLLPSVMGGSTAHRLPIQKYSLVTTPNYRHNLLQHVDRNYDRMLFTHQRLNRDYTLNFAAMNIQHSFILANLRLFPEGPTHPMNFIAIPHQRTDDIVPNQFDMCPYCIADISDVQLRFNYTHPPSVDLQESAFVILPDVDQRILRESLNILAEQRQLNIMATLNVSRPGTVEYLRLANKALVSKMLVESKQYQDELRVTVPGGLLSNTSIQALGITYQPFPMKILSWMNPEWVVEFIMHDVVLELLASYPRQDLIDSSVSAFRHRGVSSIVLPILTYFTKASAHQQLSVAFHQYQRKYHLSEPMAGIDIMNVTAFTAWVYRIGIRYIQEQLPKDQIRHYQILTTHNESQALLLQQIQPKFLNIVNSALNHSWQNYHRPRGSVLKGIFPNAGNPCHVWCNENNNIIEWINDALYNEEDREFMKWITRALILPLCIAPAVQDQPSLLRYYRSLHPLPALKLNHPRVEIYEENHLAFATLNAFMGFNFYSFVSGGCPHQTYDITRDFFPFLELVVQHFIQHLNQEPRRTWWNLWRTKVQRFSDITINHMEEEAAMSEVASHPHRVLSFLAETHERLQNPNPLHRLPGLNVNFNQRVLPTSIGATPNDIHQISPNDILQFHVLPFRWINWNQHLRVKGFSGSAACKLWEIMWSLQQLRDNNAYGVSLHLADGQGGFSTFIGLARRRFEVYFNTLQTADSTPGGFPGDWLANIPELERLHCDLTETGDLCDSDEVLTIIAFVKHALQNQSLSLLTFDAERYPDENRDDNIKMLEGLVKIIGQLGGRQTVAIVKLFLTPWMMASRPIAYLIDTCTQFKLIKPKSSRETNAEVYLVVVGVLYQYEDFQGSVHHRRFARLINSFQGLNRALQVGQGHRSVAIERLLPALLRSPYLPFLTIKQVEMTLRLTPGSINIKAHWEHNSIHHRIADILERTQRNFKISSLHQVSRGRRATAVGGIRYVLETTGRILRLKGFITILNLMPGWIPEAHQQFNGWTTWLHNDNHQQLLQATFDRIRQDILVDNIWTPCNHHDSCITSENSPHNWANEPIHLSLVHEYGTGCDMGTRVATLGWAYLNTDQGDNILQGMFRS